MIIVLVKKSLLFSDYQNAWWIMCALRSYPELSGDAKLLYSFFLDRVSLSIKNGWIDDKGRVFIYYSVKSVCEDLNCGTQKACKLLDELEKAGALERKRQGLGKPNKLYLKKVF